ncbi:MAG: nickel pincer cofactor biosynthesis protein LarC, partial [Mycobacteriales bacterium]
DCLAGASGDMLLGAVVDAGVPLATLQVAVDAVGVEPVTLSVEEVTRHGLGALLVHVEASRTTVTRTWPNIRDMLARAPLDQVVRDRAIDVFSRLAAAEARAHRITAEQVHFHEVGALDAIADVVGVCAGIHALGLTSLRASQVSLGSGVARGEHGVIPIPAPAVLELLSEVDAPVWAGPAPYEMCTPTGAALLASHVSAWGTMPPMTVRRVGTGAGRRDLDEVPNAVRLVLGEPVGNDTTGSAVVLEANIDDLDPRLWPAVLARLLDSGASDAWLTPILMKKGRPAHTLHVLCATADVPAVQSVVFAETSTIGLRQLTVGKYALDRTTATVDVDGHSIRVKLARVDGAVVNVSVEYDDVVAAAAALGRPVKLVLASATAAAQDVDSDA